MKRFFLTGFAVLISLIGFGGYSQTVANDQAQAPKAEMEQFLEVGLRESVTVWLKSGSSLTGQLTDFNQQELTLSAQDFSQSISLKEINRLEFSGDVYAIDSDGTRRKIRGEDNNTEETEIWKGFPLAAFQVQNSSNTGKLDIETIFSDEEIDEIKSIAMDSLYVINEIEFDSLEQKMTIKTMAVDL
ncbi:hypothetical protein I4641_17430 [Waterburya agarophytonicola K14]|uniref:Uncharacterized protein n=1 Tax=Waterburya agarophytonicola KI4 TaxID=2874699 RepID=A0A964BSP2_9CYAN|nr:hypothetical protein [Waterburya agarophytonicola]MCC0178755.1 hypothetical protein [Waterburya agarophytonicola KI4]